MLRERGKDVWGKDECTGLSQTSLGCGVGALPQSIHFCSSPPPLPLSRHGHPPCGRPQSPSNWSPCTCFHCSTLASELKTSSSPHPTVKRNVAPTSLPCHATCHPPPHSPEPSQTGLFPSQRLHSSASSAFP